MADDETIDGFGDSIWSFIFFKKYNFLNSVRNITICYGVFAIILSIIAIFTAIIFAPLCQYDLNYANYNGCLTNTNDPSLQHNNASSRCEVSFQITSDMKAPIQFLYYVENAYINHRKYLKSYNKKQLQGNLIDLKTVQSSCQPFVFNRDIKKTVSWSGKPLDPDAIASPCGFKGKFLAIEAFLFFNDTFKLKKIESDKVYNIQIDESQIGEKFGIEYKSRNADEQWINPENSHFISWMQSQALITKTKLWGRINTPLLAGKYSLIVENNYRINQMRINKGVRIIEVSKLGGKFMLFPILFAICAIGCGLYAIIFYRKFGFFDQKLSSD